MLISSTQFRPYIEIATITYRSGPEWDQRFGRQVRDLPETPESENVRVPALCPDFLIETYLDHQVECIFYIRLYHVAHSTGSFIRENLSV